MTQARRDTSLLLIEATSNQVNQFGGYTGQTPAQFAAYVGQIAETMSFPKENIVLGGDHLGPQVWRAEGPEKAMQKAEEMVREYVQAGFAKIHLDASMHLAGDPGDPRAPLDDEIVSKRAAALCRAAEDAHKQMPAGTPEPVYVIGTEVPVPGGELLGAHAPEVTRTEDVTRTVEVARRAFEAKGLQAAWERVIAMVVQPGVEFGDQTVFPYAPKKARHLAQFVETGWHGIFEAHSTDYQLPSALRNLVRDHFAILKVGPWLTFAFREAVFALAAVEEEWLGGRKGVTMSRVREALDEAMVANPQYWKSYYRGDEAALKFSRRYGLSDRCRYYWGVPAVAAALERLIANLTEHPAPGPLLSQYLPIQFVAIQDSEIKNDPREMIRHKILEVIDQYAGACGMGTQPSL